MRKSLNFDNVSTGAAADTYRTIAALIAAATTGHRARILSLCIGPADNSPVDANLSVQCKIVADVSAGSVGTPSTSVNAAAMRRPDSRQRDGVITGGIDYSGGEPSTYGNPFFQMDFNTRGGFFKEWDYAQAPVIDDDQLFGVLVAPRTASVAIVSGCIEFEEF